MSSTVTTTTTATRKRTAARTVVSTGIAPPKSQIRVRATRWRRLSAPSSNQPSLRLCRSLSYNLEALDLSSASPTQALASLRFLVLSYLADLERRLTEFASPWTLQGEYTVEDAAQWARTALEMLEGIRADVCSHLPDFPFADLSSAELFVKSHLPDIPDVPNFTEMRSHFPDIAEMRSHMADMRAHLPDMPSLPAMDDVRSHFSDMRHKFDDVRIRFQELDFQGPLSYIPTLSDRLDNLNSHLSSIEVDAPFMPNTGLYDLLDSLLNSDVITDILNSKPTDVLCEGEDMFERAAYEVAAAVKRSFEGVRLIKYDDLPHPWRNNPFVEEGYRFIPIERWPLLILSLFKPHNELLNIHTHLIPFLLWGINMIPLINSSQSFDAPEMLFMAFALLCLSSSALWHTMSGCANRRGMELCARVDYVGIGWLISASVGTVVHYGFQCHPSLGRAFLVLCFSTGLAGNIFPFMAWFNKHEYRFYRIGFFLALAFSGAAPMVAMAYMHSRKEMHNFVAPIYPSLASYIIGLVFYAAHFPERVVPAKLQRKLDMVGGNSHAIWHCFIVLAVSQHRTAIAGMKEGLRCLVP